MHTSTGKPLSLRGTRHCPRRQCFLMSCASLARSPSLAGVTSTLVQLVEECYCLTLQAWLQSSLLYTNAIFTTPNHSSRLVFHTLSVVQVSVCHVKEHALELKISLFQLKCFVPHRLKYNQHILWAHIMAIPATLQSSWYGGSKVVCRRVTG